MLAGWAAEQDAAGSRRGEAVRAAVDAGLGKSGVHRLAGLARTAVGRIAGAVPAVEADRRCPAAGRGVWPVRVRTRRASAAGPGAMPAFAARLAGHPGGS